MTKFKQNDLRDKWYESCIEYLDKKGLCNEPYFVCPRCGMRETKIERCDFSQYYPDMVICRNCLDDEIIRDSVGSNQADISRWYITTKVKLSYILADIEDRGIM